MADTITVARSIGEAARMLGITAQTIRNWLMVPGFPGRSGRPGTFSEGYFPIDEIRRWRDSEIADTGRPAGGTQPSVVDSGPVDGAGESTAAEKSETVKWMDLKRQSQAEIAHIESQHAKIKLAEKLGTIVDADDVRRLIMRFVAGSKAILEEMPDRVLARLPSEMSEGTRRLIRDEVANCVRLAAATLAEMRSGDTDETR